MAPTIENATGYSEAGSRVAPLDECRDVSAIRLKEAVAKGLDRLRPELLRVIDMAMGADSYYLYMSALELIRDHQRAIETTFHRAYLRRANQASHGDARPLDWSADSARLSLLAPEDLEESLAMDLLANAIRDNCVEELFGLDKRVGMLTNDPDLLDSENPFGPAVIARAMMDALEGFEADIKTRLLLMTQLSKLLPGDVRDIYRDLNQLLIQRNVLPTIRVGLRRSGQAAAPVPGTAETTGGAGEMLSSETRDDLFAMFKQLVSMTGGMRGRYTPSGAAQSSPANGAAAADSAPVAAPPPLQTGAIMHSLNELQRGRASGLSWSGLDAEILDDGRVNMLHGLRTGGMAQANALDAMTLDIVAMVFDYILDDRRIPDAMKALIGRLQIPVLKVAMLDKSFFSKKGHHVRKLLDALAGAAISLDPKDIHESGLYRKAEELVERILEQFDDRIEIFSEVLAELHDYLAQEQHKAESAVISGIEVIKLREAVELSRQAAHNIVQECLLGHPLPLGIQDFVIRYWQRLLMDVHLKFGAESSAWKIAVSTMGNLIWSVEPKYDPTERSSLVALIPSLLMELNMGADKLEMPRDDRELFFATLAPCHTLALKGVMLENEATVRPVMVEMAVPPLAESNEFEPVRAPEGGPGKRAAPAAIPESAQSAIEGLVVGSWVEYTRDDGTVQVTRLAWISPLKGIYMFANRQGQAALSITPRGLQSKLRTGEVRLLDDAPLMDRVVDKLVDRFQREIA
jgi:hypothetical protein